MARAGPSASLRLHLLGRFGLAQDDQPIQLPTRKAESLLAYLAQHPGEHAREKIAALFWGESPDEDARRSLRVALAALRKVLGDDALLADRETILLNPEWPLWVDALEFKSLISNH
jgi:DNA-binding SARP family transcriptional activator